MTETPMGRMDSNLRLSAPKALNVFKRFLRTIDITD